MTYSQHTDPHHDDDTTAGIAQDLYEQVRQLNHATAGPTGLTRPSTAYTVLGNLSGAAYGLDQALAQLDRFLRRELEDGRLGHDQGRHPDRSIQDACRALTGARADTTRLARSLDEAQSAISAIHGPIQPPTQASNPVELAAGGFPVPIAEALQADRADSRAEPSPTPPDPSTRTVGKGA